MREFDYTEIDKCAGNETCEECPHFQDTCDGREE